MKVDIKHDEVKKGLVFKKLKHLVIFRVELTETEKKVIKDHDMELTVLVDMPMQGGRHMSVRPGHFLKNGTHEYEFDTTYDAQKFEEKLVAGLKQMKAMIEKRGGATTTSKSFDL